MPQFGLNPNGVFTKPRVYKIHECSKFLVKIKVARLNRRWFWGHEYAFKGKGVGCGGGSCLPSKSYRSAPTEIQAKKEAAKFLIRIFKENPRHPTGKPSDVVLAKLYQVITPQTELFDRST